MSEIFEGGCMNKSIRKRFIRAWKLRFRHICDSKVSPYWRKRDIKGFLRNTAIISADGLLYELAEDLAKQALVQSDSHQREILKDGCHTGSFHQ